MTTYDSYGNPIGPRRFSPGCLWGIVIAVAIVGFVVGLMFLIFGAFTSSEPYQHALSAARHDETVTTIMGTPINPGIFTTGSLRSSGISASADLQIPISGPKKSGTLYVTAERRNGRWIYFTLAVEVDNQIITLSP
jgi:hypothetical protein